MEERKKVGGRDGEKEEERVGGRERVREEERLRVMEIVV